MKLIIHGVICVIACCLPFMAKSGHRAIEATSDYRPIDRFDGAGLVAASMSPQEQEFYKEFPGRVAYFRLDGRPGETVFLRYTESPTRQLHPAETCLRARGLDVTECDKVAKAVAELSDRPLTWSRCVVKEDSRSTEVLQTIVSLPDRRNYSDIPSWYWLTTFSNDDPGPWLAVVWCRPVE